MLTDAQLPFLANASRSRGGCQRGFPALRSPFSARPLSLFLVCVSYRFSSRSSRYCLFLVLPFFFLGAILALVLFSLRSSSRPLLCSNMHAVVILIFVPFHPLHVCGCCLPPPVRCAPSTLCPCFFLAPFADHSQLENFSSKTFGMNRDVLHSEPLPGARGAA